MDEDVAALSIMGVQISLTKKGVAHWEEVLEVLYAQIALLKASDLSAAAADARASDALAFRYSPKAPASDEASSLASSLRLCASEPERLLACRRVATAFDAPLTARLLDLLTPDRMVVLLKSTTLAANVTGNSTGDATEPHYGTLHRPLDLPPALLARLAAPPAVASLTLPAANALLPDSFTLLSGAPPGRHEPPALADGATPTRRLWHLADTTYKLPTAEVRVRWAVPEVGASAEGGVMASLLSSILAEQRRSDRYDAERAGISADVSPSTFGFEVDASGFSQRLPEAVRRAVAAVTSMQISEDELAIAKEKYARALAATLTEQPAERASQLTSKVLAEVAYLPAERSSALQNVSRANLAAFADGILGRAVLKETLVIGNLDAAAARTIHDDGPGPPPDAQVTAAATQRIANLEGRWVQYAEAAAHPKEAQSAVKLIVQLGRLPIQQAAVAQLLSAAISQPFFDDLRTKQQLGYVVRAGLSVLQEVYHLAFIVQGTAKPPPQMAASVHAFVHNAAALVANLTATQFTQFVASTNKSLLDPPLELRSKAEGLWTRIAERSYDFDRARRVAAALSNATQAQVEAMAESLGSGGAGRLLVQVHGADAPLPTAADDGYTLVKGGVGAARGAKWFAPLDDPAKWRKHARGR